jgi:hypothetical protein
MSSRSTLDLLGAPPASPVVSRTRNGLEKRARGSPPSGQTKSRFFFFF